MFFTREDILKIQQALLQLSVKDSELPSAEPVTYDDTLSIVQEGKNNQIKIKDFFNQISLWKREDFINITDKYDEHYISLIEAINLVPILQRKDGLVITFQDIEGNWEIYQFRGNITEFFEENKWFNLYDYRNYIVQSIVPDEEDLTVSTPNENGNSLVHLKDRVYNPAIFNGKGYKFVRKNIINVELATIKISVINPITLEGDVYFNINNKGTTVHLSPTIHNTTKLVSEAIKDALVVAYNDYEITVANSIVTLTRKYSGNTSPTTFEMYNTGVKVIVEDTTIIEERNVITQENINEEDTIYEIRYDFDLDGKTITIPNNCVLYFTSGKFYNGNINMDNTIVSTLYEDVLSGVNVSGNYYNIQEHIKNHQSQLDDKQAQIDDKQQQITANDEDISLLQTRSTQIEETINGIAATGGASLATAVTYNNKKSKLTAINIQNAVDEIVEKTAIKDEEGVVVETPFRYIQNEEFIFAKVDAEDKLLFGIQWDGTPKFGKTSTVEDRLQAQVNLLADKITTILGDNNTTSAIDTLKELKNFFANIDNTQTLTSILANLNSISTKLGEDIKNLQDTKVDKEEGKSLIEDEVKECFRVIENEEFINAVVDSEDRILYGIYRDTGKPYYPQNDMYHISQSEEFLWVILDTANHPLLGIQQDGTCWAAKAQWLDDIRVIKEALSSINETIKTFQPKEDGKGLINLDVAESFFYISNDEYIIAVVDVENRILAGIKYDGKPYFPLNEMYHVEQNEEFFAVWIDAANHVLLGIRRDGEIIGEIHAVNALKQVISKIQSDLASLQEKVGTIDTNLKELIDVFSLQEYPEYLAVEKDAEGKVLSATNVDGSHYIHNVKSETIDNKVDKENGMSLINSDVAASNFFIEDSEERVKIIKDKENRIIGFIDSQGNFHANTNIFSKNINNLQNVSDNFCLSSYSGDVDIVLEEPRIAEVRLYASKFPLSKTSDIKGKMKFISGKVFFERNVLINLQGNTSLGMAKKNIAIDIMNSDYSDNLKIRFGEWVPQDSFHMKCYYFDLTKGVAPSMYSLYKQIEESRGIENDRPYKAYKKSIGNMLDKPDVNDCFNYEPLCHPMGFPCILYYNDDFYGIMSFQLKKHRDNYAMSKKEAKHIHLDGVINLDTIFNGNVNWEAFEIRNPKSLITSTGGNYDGDNPSEIIGTTDEKYNSLNKNHIISGKVKSSIIQLSKYKKELDGYIAENSSSTENIRIEIEKKFNVNTLIDYLLFIWIGRNTDSMSKNWQWVTYDGVIWSILPYDLDSCWGIGAVLPINELNDSGLTFLFGMNDFPLSLIYTYYLDDLKQRWEGLRNKGIVDTENIFGLYYDWYKRVGVDNIKKELERWDESPCYRSDKFNKKWKRTNNFYITYNAHDTTWTNATIYSKDEFTKYKNRCYKSLANSNVNHLPTDDSYWEDVTYVEGKTYNVGDKVYWGYCEFFECECLEQTSEKPFELYSQYPYELGCGYESIDRVYRFIKNTIAYLDLQLNYKL